MHSKFIKKRYAKDHYKGKIHSLNRVYTKNLLKHHINISLMNVIQFKSNQNTKYFA